MMIRDLPDNKGFPDSSAGKESACNAGDPCSTPEWGKSPGEGKGYPLQYSGLENSLDYGGHKELDRTEGLSLALHFIKSKPVVSPFLSAAFYLLYT